MFSYKQIQSLNELEMEVYNYVIMHLDQVATMKIRELADSVHVSTTTIMRFCAKLDCDGYSEFKIKVKMLRKEKQNSKIIETPQLMIEFFKRAQTQEFEELLDRAVELIMDSSNIIFYGIGTSGILGKYGARFLSNIGKYAQYLEDPFYPFPREHYDGAVLVALSVQGEQRTVIDQINGYKSQHSKVIAITATETSTIAKMSDLNIAYYMPLNIIGSDYNITAQAPVIYILETIGRKCQMLLQERK